MAINARVAVAASGKKAPIKAEHKLKTPKDVEIEPVDKTIEKLIKEVKNGDKRKTSD